MLPKVVNFFYLYVYIYIFKPFFVYHFDVCTIRLKCLTSSVLIAVIFKHFYKERESFHFPALQLQGCSSQSARIFFIVSEIIVRTLLGSLLNSTLVWILPPYEIVCKKSSFTNRLFGSRILLGIISLYVNGI